MAGERVLPGTLGLTAFHNLGDNTWKPTMDDNFLRLSALTQLTVISRTAALPSGPPDGDIYIVPSTDPTNPNQIAIRDDGNWYYFSPKPGLIAHVQDDDFFWRWYETDAEWRKLRADGDVVFKEVTSSYTLTQDDFFGNVVIEANFPVDDTITVPAGLSKAQPVIIESTGIGVPTVVAAPGVTVQSADTALKIRTQFSTALLLPKGNDIYSLSGDIET